MLPGSVQKLPLRQEVDSAPQTNPRTAVSQYIICEPCHHLSAFVMMQLVSDKFL